MIEFIKGLDEKVEKLIDSLRNQDIARTWRPQEYTAKDHWRGIPLPSSRVKTIPFTVGLEIPMWAQILVMCRNSTTTRDVTLRTHLG